MRAVAEGFTYLSLGFGAKFLLTEMRKRQGEAGVEKRLKNVASRNQTWRLDSLLG
jgi:hypothetical protein